MFSLTRSLYAPPPGLDHSVHRSYPGENASDVHQWTFVHLPDEPPIDVRFEQLVQDIQVMFRDQPPGTPYLVYLLPADPMATPRQFAFRNIDRLTSEFLLRMFEQMVHSDTVQELTGFRVQVSVPANLPSLVDRGRGRLRGWKLIPAHLKKRGLTEHPDIEKLPAADRASFCGFRALLLGRFPPDHYDGAVHLLQQQARALAVEVFGPDNDGSLAVERIGEVVDRSLLFRDRRVVLVNRFYRCKANYPGPNWFWDPAVRYDERDPRTVYVFWDDAECHFWGVGAPATALRINHANGYVFCYACSCTIHRDNLTVHNCHEGRGRFQCKACLEPFGDDEAFQDHRRKEGGHWDCESCGRSRFCGRDCFDRHQRTNCYPAQSAVLDAAHPGTAAATCRQCRRTYRQPIDPEAPCAHVCPRDQACNFCKLVYTTPEEKETHRCTLTPESTYWDPVSTHPTTGKVTWQSHWFYDFETSFGEEVDGRREMRVMAWCFELMLPDEATRAYVLQPDVRAALTHMDSLPPGVRADVQWTWLESGHLRLWGTALPTMVDVVTRLLARTSKEGNWRPVFWAHNGQGFDAKFLLDHFLNEMDMDLSGQTYLQTDAQRKTPEFDPVNQEVHWVSKSYRSSRAVVRLLNVGSKILQLKVANAAFRCSQAHHPMALRKLPSLFGLEGIVRKGEFPYRRLVPTAWGSSYPDGLPPLADFDIDGLSSERRNAVIAWWIEEQARRGVARTRIVAELAELSESDALTHQSVVDRHMPPTYVPRDVPEPWVFDTELWEYLFNDVTVGRACMEAYHAKAVDLHAQLWLRHPDRRGKVVSPLLKCTSPGWALAMYRTWFVPADTIYLLKPAEAKLVRDSLRGGRTDKRANWVEVSPERRAAGDKIVYVDFKSLYPSVQKCSIHDTHFPVGRPEWGRFNGPIRDNAHLIELMGDRTGFLAVSFRATKYVTHPTLHNLMNKPSDDPADPEGSKDPSKKLIFGNLSHWWVTYAWPELLEAMRCEEIVVTQVHDVLLFRKGDTVFNEYVDFFFAVKEHAEQQENEGLRTLAKLLLNSLWGKLGQNAYPIRECVQYSERLHYLWRKFENGDFTLLSYIQREPQRVWIQYRDMDATGNLNQTAHHIAAFVSMWGRVTLHRKLLAEHGQRALYCDTDSAIVYLRPTDRMPYVGNDIGDLTNEVPKILKSAGYKAGRDFSDPYIAEAVLVAPKTYGLRIKDDNFPSLLYHKVVSKGFEPSHTNARVINFTALKDLVFTANNLKAHNVKRKRPLQEEEIDMGKRLFLKDHGRLQFVSRMSDERVRPVQRYLYKKMTGRYTKGTTVEHEPRLVRPFSDPLLDEHGQAIPNSHAFLTPEDTFLSFEHPDRHYP